MNSQFPNTAVLYRPCGSVGGDLPLFYKNEYGSFFAVADVCGKGEAAAKISLFARDAFPLDADTPSRALNVFCERFRAAGIDQSKYVTFALAMIDGEYLRYSLAGHSVPMLLKSEGKVFEIYAHSPPVSDWFDSFSYRDGVRRYQKGDMLFLYTDGLTDSASAEGERLTTEAIKRMMTEAESADELIGTVKKRLREIDIVQKDDITALALDL